MAFREELRQLILRHMTGPISDTAVPGVRLYGSNSRTPVSARLVYEPMICIMVQGEKRVVLGSQTIRHTPEHYLINSVHLPVTRTVTSVRPDEPYLALSLARTFGRPPQEDAAWMRSQAGMYERLLEHPTRT